MWLIVLILFALVLILFIKVSYLKQGLVSRIIELENTLNQLKNKMSHFETSFTKKPQTETEDGRVMDDQSQTDKAVELFEQTKDISDDKLATIDFQDEKVQPPPLPETDPEPILSEENESIELPETKKDRPSLWSEWVKKWRTLKVNVNWEQFTGVKLFSWIGGIALFIGVGFGVKYTIELNLISPEMRLAIAALVGISLVISSAFPNRIRYDILRQTLASGGIGVLYTVIFTATLYYHFLPEFLGFILLTIVSSTGFVLAVYHRGIAVSILGALGAYATPILVDPGQGSLIMLFIYLMIINIGLFRVMKHLNSPILFLVATVGTLISLGFGTFLGKYTVPTLTIAWVWITNLALFTFFLDSMKVQPKEVKAVSWSGNVLYVSIILLALILIQHHNEASLLLCTSGTAGAMILAFRNPGWHRRVIPYSVISFIVAILWVLTSFDPKVVSWGFLLFMIYGAFAGLGPVMVIKKYGMDQAFLYWFRIYPIAVAGLSLLAILQEPHVSFWFWPLALGLQILGIIISLIFGAVIQLGILVLIFVISGLTWIFRVPSDYIGLGFYGFLLFAGAILCVLLLFGLRKLPDWLKTLKLGKEFTEPKEYTQELLEWATASPAVGGFLLLAASFMIQKQINPHPGMATLVCFLSLSLFLCKRLSSQALGVVALLAALFTEGAWMLAPSGSLLHYSTLKWAGSLFILSLFIPFIYFNSFKKWNRVWMGWALFEVFQGLFVIWAADSIWPREYSGWIPLVLFTLKIPCVSIMLKKLEDKPERNAIIAFHGGVLLFYISAIPVLLLEYGWIGLTLVYEAMALLWLNRRIEHSGLRWVAAFMAPIGLILLFVFLPEMKKPNSLIILNSGILSVAGAVIALSFSVNLGGFPQRFLRKMDMPNYFLWLVLGAGFGLLNLIIADIFAEPGTGFRFLSGRNHLQSIWYSLIWAGFGAALWKIGSLTKAMRMVGLTVLCLATARLIFLPYIFPHAIPEMEPIINTGLLAYLPLIGILIVLYLKEPSLEKTASAKNLFLVLILVVSFIFIKVEKSTFFQTGQAFALFKSRTLSMAVASSAGWFSYGLGLLIWPRKLDKNFRVAGFILFLFGLGKGAILPFRFRLEFGDLVPMINSPTFLYVAFICVITFLALKKKDTNWPIPKLNRKVFWGVLLAVTTFYVLNIEIASAFGMKSRPFSLLTHGSLAHQLGYSLGWLIFAGGLLVVGIKVEQVKVRWAALILLVFTSFKIFIMDLWKLGQWYRVASFIGLAVVLIMVSFLYQRFLSQEDEYAKQK